MIKNNRIRQLVMTAMLASLALIVFIIEHHLPPLVPLAPGVKIGLSNIFVMLAVIVCGNISGICVVFVKCLLGSIYGGNISALLYSLPASIASLLVFILLYQFLSRVISLVSISVASACVFNFVQIVTASLIVASAGVFYYLPYVLIVSILTGIFTGSVIFFVVKHIPLDIIFKNG